MARREGREAGRLGFDETKSYLSSVIGRFVPQSVARRSITASVEADRKSYALGETVSLTATFRNRLPVPVEVTTPRQRLWGWRVDGELEASDLQRYTRSDPTSFQFRPREAKRISFSWNGRFERSDGMSEYVLPDPGEYEIEVFVATADRRPRANISIVLEATDGDGGAREATHGSVGREKAEGEEVKGGEVEGERPDESRADP